MASSSQTSPRTVKVKIDWIRHAYSCANYLLDSGNKGSKVGFDHIGDKRSKLAPDAGLTNFGIEQARVAGDFLSERYSEYDLFMTSEMRRAIQTAIEIFPPSKKIHVVPYITEIINSGMTRLRGKLSKDNLPALLVDQKKWFKDNYSNLKFARLDFSEVENMTPKWPWSKKPSGNPSFPNYKKFTAGPLKNLITKILEPDPSKNEIKIAIVSHSHFIMDNVLQKFSLYPCELLIKGYRATSKNAPTTCLKKPSQVHPDQLSDWNSHTHTHTHTDTDTDTDTDTASKPKNKPKIKKNKLSLKNTETWQVVTELTLLGEELKIIDQETLPPELIYRPGEIGFPFENRQTGLDGVRFNRKCVDSDIGSIMKSLRKQKGSQRKLNRDAAEMAINCPYYLDDKGRKEFESIINQQRTEIQTLYPPNPNVSNPGSGYI